MDPITTPTPTTRINEAQTPPPPPELASEESAASSVLSSDFETFLKMLSVQLQNQDPLNPVNAEDYAMQLATFAQVEQAVLTNNLLGQLKTQSATATMVQSEALIGKQVRVAGPAWYGGQSISVAVSAHPDADAARLIVRSAAGDRIDSVEIDPTSEAVTWSGSSSYGAAVPDGAYSFEVESYQGDRVIQTKAADSYSGVAETRMLPDGLAIVTPQGGVIPNSAIVGVKN